MKRFSVCSLFPLIPDNYCGKFKSMLADALHAIGIQDNNGIELLIRIGLDTVELNGSGFTPFVSINEEVELGQPIMKVDVPKIEANGKKSVIPLVVTNNENNHYTMVWNKLDTVEAGKTVLFQLKAPIFSPNAFGHKFIKKKLKKDESDNRI